MKRVQMPIKRDRRLKRAIRQLRGELLATNSKTHPVKWANAHARLAQLYFDQSAVQRPTLNLRQAQLHLRKAEQVFTRRRYPNDWATIHAQHGHLVAQYPWLGRISRRLRAIEHEKLALEVFTRKACPGMWAELQQNIGWDYGVLFGLRRKPEDLQRCYQHLHKALTVYRRLGSFPARRKVEKQCATTSKILKSRYFKSLKGHKARQQ